MKKQYPKKYLQFIQLFNQEKYFEAHEVLEDLWKETTGDLKLFYQGLIQSAVALHHYRKGNLYGALYEYQIAKQKLKKYPKKFMGVDTSKLLTEIKNCLRERGRS